MIFKSLSYHLWRWINQRLGMSEQCVECPLKKCEKWWKKEEETGLKRSIQQMIST